MAFARGAAALAVATLALGTVAVSGPASAQREAGQQQATAPYVRHTAVAGRHGVRMYDAAVSPTGRPTRQRRW